MIKKNDILKLAILISIILIIPLVFISFEIIYKLNKSDDESTNVNQLDKTYTALENTTKNTDSSDLRKCLEEIFDLMNDKNFDKLYSLLTDDIKDVLFPTQDSFNKYMNKYIKNQYSPSFSSYEKTKKDNESVFIVKVKYLLKSTSEHLLNENMEEQSDTFVIYFNDINNYKFSFADFLGTKIGKKEYTTETFSCKILKTHLYNDKTTFVISFDNKSDSNIIIDKGGIYCSTGAVERSYAAETILPPNSSKTIFFTIYTGFSVKSSLPDKIYFKGIHSDGLVHFFSIPVKYPL